MNRILFISLFQDALFAEKDAFSCRSYKKRRTRGQIIIGLLFVLLLMAIYIYFERWFAIRAAGRIDKSFMDQIKLYVDQGKIDAAHKPSVSKKTAQ